MRNLPALMAHLIASLSIVANMKLSELIRWTNKLLFGIHGLTSLQLSLHIYVIDSNLKYRTYVYYKIALHFGNKIVVYIAC